MNTVAASQRLEPDPAAIFAAAISLWQECHRVAGGKPRLSLSDLYSGMDGFMREVMRVAELFEKWACDHVIFEELEEVWPYLLQDRFGVECLSIMMPENLSEFDERDCLRLAARLRLRVR